MLLVEFSRISDARLWEDRALNIVEENADVAAIT